MQYYENMSIFNISTNISEQSRFFPVYVDGLQFETPWKTTMLALCCLIFVINTVVIVIFTKKVLRNSTSILIIGIAISDTLTGLSCNVISFFMHKGYLKYPVCIIFSYTEYMCYSFHLSSVLFTTALALQRLIVVRYPFKGPRYVPLKLSYWILIVTPIFALIVHISVLTFSEYMRNGDIFKDLPENICLVKGVTSSKVRKIFFDIPVYTNYIVSLLCSCSMFIITIYLAVKIRHSKMSATRTISKEEQETKRRNSMMIVLILVFFLLAEIPRTTLFMCISSYDFFKGWLCWSIRKYILVVSRLSFQAGACVNILIYIMMSRKFRTIFVSWFNCYKKNWVSDTCIKRSVMHTSKFKCLIDFELLIKYILNVFKFLIHTINSERKLL